MTRPAVPGLVFAYTDPRTGFDYPEAFLVIDDARVHWIAQLAVLGISIYASRDLYLAGKDPIFSNPDVYLTGAEIATEQANFIGDLYTLLAARPVYSGATIVT